MEPVPSGIVRATLVNKIDETEITKIYTPVIPRVGELVDASATSAPDDSPFKQHTTWRVDQVVYAAARPGSVYWLARIRDDGVAVESRAHLLSWVDLYVWPEQGPYWTETTPWAKILAPPDPDDEDDEDET